MTAVRALPFPLGGKVQKGSRGEIKKGITGEKSLLLARARAQCDHWITAELTPSVERLLPAPQKGTWGDTGEVYTSTHASAPGAESQSQLGGRPRQGTARAGAHRGSSPGVLAWLPCGPRAHFQVAGWTGAQRQAEHPRRASARCWLSLLMAAGFQARSAHRSAPAAEEQPAAVGSRAARWVRAKGSSSPPAASPTSGRSFLAPGLKEALEALPDAQRT